MNNTSEKGGGSFKGIRLLLCENPLPPLDEAIEAATSAIPTSNFYTQAFSAPLRNKIAKQIGVPYSNIHINAGSELILRQLFAHLGQQVHLLTPTYPLFPEIAVNFTTTRLLPENDFKLELTEVDIPDKTTLFVIVNPNNPNGGTFNMDALPELLHKHQDKYFLVDEAYIGVAGQTVAHLVPEYGNLIVTRTFSKAESLAGFRVGYAILPQQLAAAMNSQNDAYPLARASEAAAIATLSHQKKIYQRVEQLKDWTNKLSEKMRQMGIHTYPTETYFFLADFAPLSAKTIAKELADKGFLVKALEDEALGEGFMRITTSTPKNNKRFIQSLDEVLTLAEH